GPIAIPQAVRLALASHELRRDERLTVSAAKVLVAALPDSLDAIAGLLKVHTGKYAYEVHCSLFVFLSDIHYLELRREDKTRAVELILSYIESARVRTALAAWMAGDAIGGLCNRS